MKSAEEWSMQFVNQGLMLAPLVGNKPTAAMAIVEQIQLAAIKEGMRRAAKILTINYRSVESFNDQMANATERAILTASEQLKKTDLY